MNDGSLLFYLYLLSLYSQLYSDLEIIHAELRAKDLERCTNALEALKKTKGDNSKERKDNIDAAEKVKAWLEEDKDVRFGNWSIKEIDWLNNMQFISAKPVIYLVNMSERDYIRKKNKWLPKIHAWVQEHGGDPIIPFSGALEQTLFDMPDDEKEAYCKEHECVSVLPKIIVSGFRAVNLIYFFTAGPDEVKCWQIRKGSKAPQAAGAIHTDFERGFICAEVMHFEELKELGSESAVKAAGKYRQEGKAYEVKDGDIIFFKYVCNTPLCQCCASVIVEDHTNLTFLFAGSMLRPVERSKLQHDRLYTL